MPISSKFYTEIGLDIINSKMLYLFYEQKLLLTLNITKIIDYFFGFIKTVYSIKNSFFNLCVLFCTVLMNDGSAISHANFQASESLHNCQLLFFLFFRVLPCEQKLSLAAGWEIKERRELSKTKLSRDNLECCECWIILFV